MVIAAINPNKKDLKLLVKYLRIVFWVCEVVMPTDPEDAVKAVHRGVLTAFVATTDSYTGNKISHPGSRRLK